MSGTELMRVVNGVPGPKTVVLEEGPSAQWIKELLSKHVERVMICNPRTNRLISKAGFMNDERSALTLAELQIGNYTEEVVHPDSHGAELRRVFNQYYRWNKEIVATKSRLKATFRQAGVQATGSTIYSSSGRKSWRAKLSGEPALLMQAEQYWALLEFLEQSKSQTFKVCRKLAQQNPAYAMMDSLPGADQVISTGYVALIGAASRFARKNLLWSYFGLGNGGHKSGSSIDSTQASDQGNRIAKWLVGQHVRTVLNGRQPNRFKDQYESCLRRGLSHGDACRSVARSLLSVARVLWIKGEKYQETR